MAFTNLLNKMASLTYSCWRKILGMFALIKMLARHVNLLMFTDFLNFLFHTSGPLAKIDMGGPEGSIYPYLRVRP